MDKQLEIRFLTKAQRAHTTAYPTCWTWSGDGRFLFVESGESGSLDRDVLRIDVGSGEITPFAKAVGEDVSRYGAGHIEAHPDYVFDCAQDAGVMVCVDTTRHNLYLMDMATGKTGHILNEREGTMHCPPSITPDATRVIYHVRYPSVPNRYFGGSTSTLFALDLDPSGLRAASEPRLITAYPARMSEAAKHKMPDGVILNHCQVNPRDPDHYCYCHEFRGVPPDGSLTLTRCWQNRKGLDEPVYRPNPGEWQTHEVIGASGKTLYFVENWGVSAVEFETGRKRRICDAGEFKLLHMAVSSDEKWIAADMIGSTEVDEHGLCANGVVLVEAATGRSRLLCTFPSGRRHPRHPHPSFSPDGAKIAFTVADGPENSQVACVDITALV